MHDVIQIIPTDSSIAVEVTHSVAAFQVGIASAKMDVAQEVYFARTTMQRAKSNEVQQRGRSASALSVRAWVELVLRKAYGIKQQGPGRQKGISWQKTSKKCKRMRRVECRARALSSSARAARATASPAPPRTSSRR
eukprot:2124388-Pleurochrysis_carterae.AAC.1